MHLSKPTKLYIKKSKFCCKLKNFLNSPPYYTQRAQLKSTSSIHTSHLLSSNYFMTVALKSLFFLSPHRHLSLFLLLSCPSLTYTQCNQNPTHPTKCLLLCEAFPDPSQLHQNESPLPGTPLFVPLTSPSFILQVVNFALQSPSPPRSDCKLLGDRE